MRTRVHRGGKTPWGAGALLCLLVLLLFAVLGGERAARAGGPLVVGGNFGPSGQPFTFDTTFGPIRYRTDGGGLGVLTNDEANARVAQMFQVWADIPTASLSFSRAGKIFLPSTFSNRNVDTISEFAAVEGSCSGGEQSPIVYDKDGTLFNALFGFGSGVIGFAGPCALSGTGRIVTAIAALNGDFLDGDTDDWAELTDNEFDAVFIHEFGHFFGLDHSQVNRNCLSRCADFSDDTFGLPTMFPFLIGGLQETPGVHPARTLSQDDIAWVSKL